MPVLLSFSYSIISIHALLAESDRQSGALPQPPPHISIHALLAESDLLLCLFLRFLNRISIHALLAESDRHRAAPTRPGWAFLSTLSLRRATTRGQGAPLGIPYFYPRSPCGERRFVRCRFWVLSNISIHALLAESDAVPLESYFLHSLFLSTLSLRRATVHVSAACADYHISIHALLAESDVVAADKLHDFPKFLSTLSLRRAT